MSKQAIFVQMTKLVIAWFTSHHASCDLKNEDDLKNEVDLEIEDDLKNLPIPQKHPRSPPLKKLPDIFLMTSHRDSHSTTNIWPEMITGV